MPDGGIDEEGRKGLSGHDAGSRRLPLLNVKAIANAAFHSPLRWSTPFTHLDIHLDDLHHLAAWYRRVAARDAVKLAIKEEGLTATA